MFCISKNCYTKKNAIFGQKIQFTKKLLYVQLKVYPSPENFTQNPVCDKLQVCVQCYIILPFAVLYCTALCSVVLHSPVQCCIELHCAVLYCTAPFIVVLHCPLHWCIALPCAVLYCTALCSVVLNCPVQCCIARPWLVLY